MVNVVEDEGKQVVWKPDCADVCNSVRQAESVRTTSGRGAAASHMSIWSCRDPPILAGKAIASRKIVQG